jgi:hypothetical protein
MGRNKDFVEKPRSTSSQLSLGLWRSYDENFKSMVCNEGFATTWDITGIKALELSHQIQTPVKFTASTG